MKITILGLFFLISSYAFGQQMVYKPVNPNFGGETFNYQQLMSSASAQNPYDDSSSKYSSYSTSNLSSFEDQINRKILNQISNSLFGNDYGVGTNFENGIYNVGSLNVNIQDYYGGVTIRIIDIKTGEQTNITIPNM
ncbi:curli assembly protein CsgF [Faecalibacter macacae]|uniref:Curli production assembly/transport component CsgF n=1 Tax=Faecalibacter macacae TaxID=1859289 RepID=A0A3L9M007_9FLAO|nr:curli assembly protein CsgF [Faecalibacter macacae]RLZ06490.1 curli assembly protein CsgF [Faecalibacter macacae]